MAECPDHPAAEILGHERPWIYDGTLFWSCLVCGRAWPASFPPDHYAYETAKRQARWFTAAFQREVPGGQDH